MRGFQEKGLTSSKNNYGKLGLPHAVCLAASVVLRSNDASGLPVSVALSPQSTYSYSTVPGTPYSIRSGSRRWRVLLALLAFALPSRSPAAEHPEVGMP